MYSVVLSVGRTSPPDHVAWQPGGVITTIGCLIVLFSSSVDDGNDERDDDHYDGGDSGIDVDDGGNMSVCVRAYINVWVWLCVLFSAPRIAKLLV